MSKRMRLNSGGSFGTSAFADELRLVDRGGGAVVRWKEDDAAVAVDAAVSEHARSRLSDQGKVATKLSTAQSRVVTQVTQQRKNVLVMGGAGVGKMTLVLAVLANLRQTQPHRPVVVLAPKLIELQLRQLDILSMSVETFFHLGQGEPAGSVQCEAMLCINRMNSENCLVLKHVATTLFVVLDVFSLSPHKFMIMEHVLSTFTTSRAAWGGAQVLLIGNPAQGDACAPLLVDNPALCALHSVVCLGRAEAPAAQLTAPHSMSNQDSPSVSNRRRRWTMVHSADADMDAGTDADMDGGVSDLIPEVHVGLPIAAVDERNKKRAKRGGGPRVPVPLVHGRVKKHLRSPDVFHMQMRQNVLMAKVQHRLTIPAVCVNMLVHLSCPTFGCIPNGLFQVAAILQPETLCSSQERQARALQQEAVERAAQGVSAYMSKFAPCIWLAPVEYRGSGRCMVSDSLFRLPMTIIVDGVPPHELQCSTVASIADDAVTMPDDEFASKLCIRSEQYPRVWVACMPVCYGWHLHPAAVRHLKLPTLRVRVHDDKADASRHRGLLAALSTRVIPSWSKDGEVPHIDAIRCHDNKVRVLLQQPHAVWQSDAIQRVCPLWNNNTKCESDEDDDDSDDDMTGATAERHRDVEAYLVASGARCCFDTATTLPDGSYIAERSVELHRKLLNVYEGARSLMYKLSES